MSRRALLRFLEAETKNLRQAGLVRSELELSAPQGPVLRIGGRDVANLASSDYLGLSGHAEVKRAVAAAAETWGAGVASPRAAVGSLPIHAELERALVKLLGVEAALVFASGHHANTGLFEAFLGDRDYVFCDEMVGPSVADGVRLSRARAYSYRNTDMNHLEDRLKRSRVARFRVIATEGAFPVTGRVAPLEDIYALAAKYQAVVAVDDSQGLGVLGERGQGAHGPELKDGIDLVTGSFGNALGGGAGGFVAGRAEFIAWLRQKSRTHLTSAALAPPAAGAALKAIELLGSEPRLRATLEQNLVVFKEAMAKDGGLIVDRTHPAVSILIRSAVSAQRLTDWLYRRGYFAIGYCHPVVPEGEARVSLRITNRHSAGVLEALATAIGEGMKELQIQL